MSFGDPDPGTGQTTDPAPLLTVDLTASMAVGQSGDLAIGPLYSQAFIGAIQDGFRNGMHTFCFRMTDFSGSIRIDGTMALQPKAADWAPIIVSTYIGLVNTDVVNVQGDFRWLRLAVDPLVGSVDQVQYKG